MNRTWLLTKVNVVTSLGINEAKNSDNPATKRVARRNLTSLILMCVLMIVYSLMYSLSSIGKGRYQHIPAYCLMLVSLMVFIFSFLRAGNDLFNMKTYERLIVLPFKPREIITSRFLTMLIENECYSICGFIPGVIVYSVLAKPGASFYVIALLSLPLIPLFTMAVASFLGALFTSFFAKLKHRNIVTSIISMLFLVGLIVGVYALGLSSGDDSQSGVTIGLGALEENFFYVTFFSKAMEGDWLYFLYWVLISLGSYLVFFFFTSWRFVPICLSLQKSYSRKNFKMKGQKEGSALKAFFKKDLKMYFNSRAYLINTIFGYVMMLLGAVLIAVFKDNIASLFNETSPDLGPSLLAATFDAAIPVMAGLGTIWSTITTLSLSYEGKQWWISETLPVRAKTVYDSKLLLNFAVAAPFYLLSFIIYASTCFSYLSVWGYVYAFLYPLAYIIFGAVLGLVINIRYPRFDWNNETDLVKTSGSVAFTMLIGLLIALPPIFAAFFMGDYRHYFLVPFLVVLLLASAFLYKFVIRHKLNAIAKE